MPHQTPPIPSPLLQVTLKYTAVVNIGEEDFNLDVDTGSSDRKSLQEEPFATKLNARAALWLGGYS